MTTEHSGMFRPLRGRPIERKSLTVDVHKEILIDHFHFVRKNSLQVCTFELPFGVIFVAMLFSANVFEANI